MNNIFLTRAQKIVSANNAKPYYDLAYRPAEVSYWEDLIERIQEETNKIDSPKILDIGIAYGTLSTFCKEVNKSAKLTAVDFVRYISDDLIKSLEIDFRFANFEKENVIFENNFDIILLTEVLEHFNFNPIHTINKIANILSDGGSLFISTPNSESKLWGRLKEYNSYKDMPSIEEDILIRDQHIYQFSFSEISEIMDE